VDGVVANKYYRGIGLIGADLGGGRNYYLYNAHGDVTSLTNTAGTIAQKYDYDAFGNLRDMAGYSTDNDVNPFRYCGEYFDEETGTIYLRARYYDPSTGRFTREDPIRDGLNWYAYANGNPVMFIDPLGLERIVISGGRYSDPSIKPGYKYNLIEPALRELLDWRKYNATENITWIIADAGWSGLDKARFIDAVDEKSIKVIFIETKTELINYLNTKKTNPQGAGRGTERDADKITHLSVFAHGWPDIVSLGYDYNDLS